MRAGFNTDTRKMRGANLTPKMVNGMTRAERQQQRIENEAERLIDDVFCRRNAPASLREALADELEIIVNREIEIRFGGEVQHGRA